MGSRNIAYRVGRSARIFPGMTWKWTGTGTSANVADLFSHCLVVHPGLPPMNILYVLVCDPKGKLRMETFFCTNLQAMPAQILP